MNSNKSLLAALALAAVLAAPTLAFAQTASAPAAAKPAPAAMPAPAAAASASDGKIAWYGKRFAGRKTASGQRFNPQALTMAHKTLPFGSRVKVTNTANKRSVVVRVNDRGPTTPDRIGDVSQAAARKLGMLRSGVANATLEVVGSK
jgi:rare lipoprotein A